VRKPHQAMDVNQGVAATVVYKWQDDLATRLEEGRKRVAAAKAAGSSGDTR
jgi:hypothetical protein